MPDLVHRANINHCLELLNDPNLASEKRAAIVKVLIAEEDHLSHDHEQLEFAESRAARGRELLNQLRYVRDD